MSLIRRLRRHASQKLESPINKDFFEAYGISKGKIDDPNKKVFVLFKELHSLNEKILSLESLILQTASKKDVFEIKLKKSNNRIKRKE